nr:unnamed protein product [Callosobruchus chinensis]
MSVSGRTELSSFCIITVFVSVASLSPNFVFFLTDDQDVLLNGMVPLTRLQSLVGLKGKTFTNAYGQKEAGGTQHIPKGYDWWIGLKGNSRYYNYTLSLNGTAKFFGEDYLTDVLGGYGRDFLKKKPRGKPFFMMIAPPACHAPFTPAKRHENSFAGIKAIRNPPFNYTSSDKHWLVRMPPKWLPQNVSILDDIQKHRLESLLAVDEMVEEIVKGLESAGNIDNTYIIFTSDHGFHIGQFSLPWDKRQPYETDIRIPFLISGPNVLQNTTDHYPISTVDLAPTILDLAGVEIPNNLDGVSFKQRLVTKEESSYERTLLVEYWGEGNQKSIDNTCPWKNDGNLAECNKNAWCKCQDARNNTYTCILQVSEASKHKFCSFEDNESFAELYDLVVDPYELKNIVNNLTKENVWSYYKTIHKLSKCKGRRCHGITH